MRISWIRWPGSRSLRTASITDWVGMKENAGFWLFGLGSSGISDVPPPPPLNPPDITGGTIYDVGSYRYHVFNSPATYSLVVKSGYTDYPNVTSIAAEVLVVGGGGGGFPKGSTAFTPNWCVSGAGGGGGVALSQGVLPSVALEIATYSVVVGGSTGPAQDERYASPNGKQSSVTGPSVSIVALGGGGGAGALSGQDASSTGATGGGGGFNGDIGSSSYALGGVRGTGVSGFSGGIPTPAGSNAGGGGGGGAAGNGRAGLGGNGWRPASVSHWQSLFDTLSWSAVGIGGMRNDSASLAGAGPQGVNGVGNPGAVVVSYPLAIGLLLDALPVAVPGKPARKRPAAKPKVS